MLDDGIAQRAAIRHIGRTRCPVLSAEMFTKRSREGSVPSGKEIVYPLARPRHRPRVSQRASNSAPFACPDRSELLSCISRPTHVVLGSCNYVQSSGKSACLGTGAFNPQRTLPSVGQCSDRVLSVSRTEFQAVFKFVKCRTCWLQFHSATHRGPEVC